MSKDARGASPLYLKLLDWVEAAGNKLPHPFWLFCFLIIGVMLLSTILHSAGIKVSTPEVQLLRKDGQIGQKLSGGPSFSPFSIDLSASSRSSRLSNLYIEIYRDGKIVAEEKVKYSQLAKVDISIVRFKILAQPGNYLLKIVNRSQTIEAKSLLSGGGLKWFVSTMVKNFSHFEPLGLVLVMLMGVAIAEGAGLIAAVMRAVALAMPAKLITPVLFALAACGNIGSDAGIVVVPPLAAAIYRQLGRNPIVGLLVGYVGATAGFTANLLPAGTDVLAASLTNAATGGNPEISVLANWYFMVVSVFFLAILGTLVTKVAVEPRLADSNYQPADTSESLKAMTAEEKKGLLLSLGAVGLVGILWLTALLPEGAPLRHPDPELFWRSPFFKGLIPVLFSLFAVGGIVYGKVTGTIKEASDIIDFMADAMKRMGPYIVLVLAISQFIAFFKEAKLDALVAIAGADGLKAMGFEQYPILFFVVFIIAVAVSNIFMGSASAKWAIFAPIFVPMFVTLGYHPAFTQLLYRLGDSITNCVTPLYPFFPLLLGWIAEVDKEKAKVGTVLSYLVPYAGVLLIGWVVMMIIWYTLGLPVGPGSPIRM